MINPQWQIIQVQMIKNTICARSFSVHRLILTCVVLLSRRGRNGGKNTPLEFQQRRPEYQKYQSLKNIGPMKEMIQRCTPGGCAINVRVSSQPRL